MAPTVQIARIEEPAELFCQYPGEGRPQPCYLTLDLEDGSLTCRYNPEIGNAVPMSVFHRRTLWFSIPPFTAAAANGFMADVAPLAQRILDGAEIVWDGNNDIGRLDDDANAAYDEVAERCDPQNWPDDLTVSAWDADDWFATEGNEQVVTRLGLTADTTDDELGALAGQEEADALSGDAGHVILRGVEDHLVDLRAELRSTVSEDLDQVASQIETLTEQRNALIRRLDGWGFSSRHIAGFAGISHTQIQNIAKRDAP